MASLALALICKNEAHNLPQLLKSVAGCFDEIHVTDTGSTDGTIELLKSYANDNPAECPVFLHHFEWCNDFAAARNYAFSHCKTDYIAWLDCDDVLDGREAFITWRERIMPTAEYWVATYHYAGINANGGSPCKFMRERVIKNGVGMQWQFFVHEGIRPQKADGTPASCQYATSWSVIHKRTAQDQLQDKSRNLLMFQGRGKLEPRMQYYYGKELYENNQPLEGFAQLVSASAEPTLEPHDRIMALQYACMAAMQCGQPEKAVQLAHQGLQLCPTRAEFHVMIGDALVRQHRPADAVPFFRAAVTCKPVESHAPYAGAIFTQNEAYSHYPLNQLARCYFHTERLAEAKKTLDEALLLGPNLETLGLIQELEKVTGDITIRDASTYVKVDEIIFTCVPNPIKNWDERTLATKGLGGSETALIHMARALHRLTGKRVRIFNDRPDVYEHDGVSYEPLANMYRYCKESLPVANIAWRHNIRVTPAPTYIWCHDLSYLGMENGFNYDKVLALSEFHRQWLHNVYAVPHEKIAVTRNGLDAKRFSTPLPVRNPWKVIFSSSPDRGLDRAIRVMDRVRKEIPNAELHVYYGMDSLKNFGKADEAARYEQMIAERPWVINHGNVTQDVLTREMQESAVWLYPTSFLETYCITAIEALCCGVYPVVRKFGALPDTLAIAAERGDATLIDADCATDAEHDFYAHEVVQALQFRCRHMRPYDAELFSWERVAKEWIQLMGLGA